MSGKTFVSKFPGNKCARCSKEIKIGETIQFAYPNTESKEKSHVVCPSSAPPSNSSPSPSTTGSSVLKRVYLKACYSASSTQQDGTGRSCEITLTEEWEGTVSAVNRGSEVEQLASRARQKAEEAIR